MEDDPFDGFSELSEDDFKVLDAATQFMRLSTAQSNSDDTLNINAATEIVRLKDQLALAMQRADHLEKSLVQLQQERMSKEGEASILRERLQKLEWERNEVLNKSTQKLQQSEQNKQSIEEEYKRSVEALKSELAFKDQELESLSSRLDHMRISKKATPDTTLKERKVEFSTENTIPEGFEDLTISKKSRKRNILAETSANETITEPVHIPIVTPKRLSPREILDEAIDCAEYVKDPKLLLEYDYGEILKRKDKVYRDLAETGSLLAALEIAYDNALAWLRQPIFIYFCRLLTTVLHLDSAMAHDIYNRSAYPSLVLTKYPMYKNCELIVKMCNFLTKPPFGLHPLVLQSHLDAFKRILAKSGSNYVPLEIKELIESGVLPIALSNSLEREKVLIAYLQLMAVMINDRTAVTLFVRPNPSPVEASMLALLVNVGINRFKRLDSPKKIDNYLMALTEFLLLLGKKNILPVHVAFDKRFLREMVRYMAHRMTNCQMDLHRSLTYEMYVLALHFVYVEKSIVMAETLRGGFFSLHYLLDKLIKHVPESSKLHRMVSELMNLTRRAIEDWMEDREEDRVDLNGVPKIPIEF